MKIQTLFILTLFLITGCGSTNEPSKEEKIRVQNIIESRSDNSDATLVSKVGEYFNVAGYSSDGKSCTFRIKIPATGPAIYVSLEHGFEWHCDDKAKSVINKVRILPALVNGEPVSSFASLSFDINYDYDYTRVTLKDFKAYKVNPSLPKIAKADSTLPAVNFSFDKVNNVIPVKLAKRKFETSAEFELRKKSQSKNPGESVIVETKVLYNADIQAYRLFTWSCFETLKDGTSFTLKSGTNGYGAQWSWTEKSGEIYRLEWDCSTYEKLNFQIPIEIAKSVGDKMTAMLKIDIPPQQWTTSKDYKPAEYGSRISRNIKEYTATGYVDKIFIGDSSNGKVFYVHTF